MRCALRLVRDKNNAFGPKMKDYPELNFPPCRLRAAERGGRTVVWDALRGRWLVLTPEEWVRRHLIGMLCSQCGVPAGRIAQEYPVPLEGNPQRADVVVLDRAGRPVLLAECKAPDVEIGSETFSQAVRYNNVVKAPLVMLTNGIRHYVYRRTVKGSYEALDSLPELE